MKFRTVSASTLMCTIAVLFLLSTLFSTASANENTTNTTNGTTAPAPTLPRCTPFLTTNCSIPDDDHAGHDGHDDHDDHDDHSGHAHGAHGDDHDSEGADAMKIMSIIVLFIFSVMCGGSVIFLPKYCKCLGEGAGGMSEAVFSHVGCFSAGVFLTVGVSHLLAEGSMILQADMTEAEAERYRPGYVAAVTGYLAMVFIQKGFFRRNHCHGSHFLSNDEPIPPHQAKSTDPHTEEELKDKEAKVDQNETMAVAAVNVEQDGKAGEEKQEVTEHKKGGLSAVAASFAALVIHSLAEGMALGLQSTTEGVIFIFIAIFTHQWAEDMAVAISTGKAEMETIPRVAVTMCLSCSCPIGIGIGWAMAASIPSVATGYIFSISGGVFIYIAATEIIAEELPMHVAHKNRSPWTRILSLVAGIYILYGIMVLTFNEAAHNH